MRAQLFLAVFLKLLLLAKGFAFPSSHSACLINAPVSHRYSGTTQVRASMQHFSLADRCLPGSLSSGFRPRRTIKQQSATVRFAEEQDRDDRSKDGTWKAKKKGESGTDVPSSEEEKCRRRLDQARSQLRGAMVAQRLVDVGDERNKAEAEAAFAIAEMQVAEAEANLAVEKARAQVQLARARKDPVAEAEAKVELARARKDPVAEAEAKVELARARKDPVAEAEAKVELARARKDPVAEAEAKVELAGARKEAKANLAVAQARSQVQLVRARKDPVAEAEAKEELAKALASLQDASARVALQLLPTTLPADWKPQDTLLPAGAPADLGTVLNVAYALVKDLIPLDIRSACVDQDLETQLGSFYRREANLPLLRTRDSKVQTVIDMRLPLHDNPLVKDTEGLAVLKGELDRQLQNNRFNTVVLVGASGSGKTAACFQYAAQEYSIYVECANEVVSGFQACFTDCKSTAVLQQTVYSTIAARAVVLAALVKHNDQSIMSPIEWLLLQLDGLGLTIGVVEDRLRLYTWTRSQMNQLLRSVEAVVGGGVTNVVDEINLLVSADKTLTRYGKSMDAMQAVTTILSELSACLIIAGTNVGTNQGLRAASSVAKIVQQKVSLTAVCHFSFLSSEQVEELMRVCINLDEVDPDVIEQAARTLRGRARFLAGFIELFCDPGFPAANQRKQDHFLRCLERFRCKTIGTLLQEINLCSTEKMSISSAKAEESLDALFALWMHRFVQGEPRAAGPTTGGLVMLTSFSRRVRSMDLSQPNEDEIFFDVFQDEPLLHQALKLHFAKNKYAINKLLRRIESETKGDVVGERCEDLFAAVLISGNDVDIDTYSIDPLSVCDLFVRMGIPRERHMEVVEDHSLHNANIHVDIAVKAETWEDFRDWVSAVVTGGKFRGYPAERVLIRPQADAGADLIFATRESEEVLFFPVVCNTAVRRRKRTIAIDSEKADDQKKKVLLQSQGLGTKAPASWRDQWVEFLKKLPPIKQVPILVEWPGRANAPADHMIDLAIDGVEVKAVLQDFSNLNRFVGSSRAVQMVVGAKGVNTEGGAAFP